jgi:hypothetical protein
VSKQKENQKRQSSEKEHLDREGMAQGADTADPSSLKKEVDFEGQKPSPKKKAS